MKQKLCLHCHIFCVNITAMKLNNYIDTHDLTRAALAEKLGVSQETVRRYLTGESVPRPRTMKKIYAITKGKVMANDFYTPSGAKT